MNESWIRAERESFSDPVQFNDSVYKRLSRTPAENEPFKKKNSDLLLSDSSRFFYTECINC